MAAAATIVAVVFWTRASVTLDAEEIVNRAVAHDTIAASPRPGGVRVRAYSAPSGEGVMPARDEVEAADDWQHLGPGNAPLLILVDRLKPHEFVAGQPMSARPFRHWRAHAGEHVDTVRWVRPDLISVTTTVADGAIRLAELVVHTSDFRTMTQRWRFADGVEIELHVEDAPASRPLPPPSIVADEARPSIPHRPSLDRDAIDLSVRVALHRLGVPIGQRIRVQGIGDSVRVTGSVSSPHLARQIAAAAEGASAEASVTTVEEVEQRPIPIPSPAFRRWLDTTFGQREVAESFLPQAWRQSERLEDGLFTLKSLASRYPAGKPLSASAQATLDSLTRACYRDLTTSYEALERQLAPITGNMSRVLLPDAPPDAWRATVRDLNAPLARLQARLAQFVAADTLQNAARDELRSALTELVDRIAGIDDRASHPEHR